MRLLISKLCAPTYHYNDAIRKGNKREEILQHALQIYLGEGEGGQKSVTSLDDKYAQ